MVAVLRKIHVVFPCCRWTFDNFKTLQIAIGLKTDPLSLWLLKRHNQLFQFNELLVYLGNHFFFFSRLQNQNIHFAQVFFVSGTRQFPRITVKVYKRRQKREQRVWCNGCRGGLCVCWTFRNELFHSFTTMW